MLTNALMHLPVISILNLCLMLYLIYIIKHDKKVSKKAMTVINAKHSLEQILKDMSFIITETTEKFEEQTKNAQEQVSRNLLYANMTSSKLSTTLQSISNEISKASSDFRYNKSSKKIEDFDIESHLTKKDDSNELFYSEEEISTSSPSKSILNDEQLDKEINTISKMLNEGYSIEEIAASLNIKEKKVKVILNTKKVIDL